MAEIELSELSIGSALRSASAELRDRRSKDRYLAGARRCRGKIDWRFRTEDVRLKLKRLYISLQE
jgi:hypothetical protein